MSDKGGAKLPVRPPEAANDEFADYRGPDDASFDKFIQALDRAYHRPWVMMWRSFLHGLMTGLGATIGTTVVLAALTYIFQIVDGPRLLSSYANSIGNALTEKAAEKIDERVASPSVTVYIPSPYPTPTPLTSR